MYVYGYEPWQYKQNDELPKAILAQQTAPGHMMPVPSGSAWNKQGISWGLSSPHPEVVQFTGNPNADAKPALHCKRKTGDIEPFIPTKQRITDERMAAHLNGLHISSNYTKHSLANEDLMDVLPPVESISERLKGHKIVLSEEIRKLREQPILPPSLIERLEKPCMSLVVWTPKEKIIDDKIYHEDRNTEEPRKRNGVLVPDYNTMDVDMR